MELIFIQNRQNMRGILQKLSANTKVFLVTLLPCYIAFSTYVDGVQMGLEWGWEEEWKNKANP